MKIGVVGAGAISGAYLTGKNVFPVLDVVAIADLDLAVAESKAKQFDVARVCTTDELLADPEIEVVLNLTIPKAHYSICRDALLAGKHVYVEKPLSITREEGAELVRLADERGLRTGCAPDTFLGGGHQTCRKLIDDGWIGEPIGATAFMLGHGHESWHPNPEFYYKSGGGPMFDMGPYYLTALVNMIGPIASVTGSARASFAERLITSQPKSGQRIVVETPTHIAGIVNFANGAIGTILTSFDVWGSAHSNIEVYGTEGTLQAPDPNGFGGIVRIRRMGASEWTEMPHSQGYPEEGRAMGLADMCTAIQNGRPHRASGQLGNHVLEAMHGFLVASETGARYEMRSQVERPALIPMGLPKGQLD